MLCFILHIRFFILPDNAHITGAETSRNHCTIFDRRAREKHLQLARDILVVQEHTDMGSTTARRIEHLD